MKDCFFAMESFSLFLELILSSRLMLSHLWHFSSSLSVSVDLYVDRVQTAKASEFVCSFKKLSICFTKKWYFRHFLFL